jgi:hypothetical protein
VTFLPSGGEASSGLSSRIIDRCRHLTARDYGRESRCLAEPLMASGRDSAARTRPPITTARCRNAYRRSDTSQPKNRPLKPCRRHRCIWKD